MFGFGLVRWGLVGWVGLGELFWRSGWLDRLGWSGWVGQVGLVRLGWPVLVGWFGQLSRVGQRGLVGLGWLV